MEQTQIDEIRELINNASGSFAEFKEIASKLLDLLEEQVQ